MMFGKGWFFKGLTGFWVWDWVKINCLNICYVLWLVGFVEAVIEVGLWV